MIARGFRPVVWVFMIGVAVLGCYMLNLRVAAERAELAKLDRQIILAQQNIRALQTEVGTRSRIPQLEEWNNDVLALAAPVTGQYVQQNVSLARFDTRQPQISDQAEVRMASAETGAAPAGDAPAATPAPQRAVAAPRPPVQAEVRRASLSVGPAAPAPAKREAAAPPRRQPERAVRVAARDDIRPGPREERSRTAARDERRPAPVRTASRDERRPAPVRTATRDERRTTPARTTGRAAAAPARGASGRLLASQRPARALRKDERPERRRSARD
ncbi:MAG TPA: hypothetical protein VEC11_02650 [Allosphingosinicella sp.]|nr:hypothetical protein [Allosphingosinicella sp.]